MKKLFFIFFLSAIAKNLFAQTSNFLWAKNIGSTVGIESRSMAVDKNGNIYTLGVFAGTCDLDPGPGVSNFTSLGDINMFISKLDAAGNFIWAKQMGGTKATLGNSIALDENGSIYATGYFQGTADFDPGTGVYNLTVPGIIGNNIFVEKLDAAGNFIWVKRMGETNESAYSFSIALDGYGNIYTTGYFSHLCDFDPGPGTYYLSASQITATFISKLDLNGNFVWAKQLGTGGLGNDVYGYSIAIDQNENVYTTGTFSGSPDFDPDPGPVYLLTAPGSGTQEIYICKLTASGDFIWAKRMGGTEDEFSNKIAIDSYGNAYTTGYFNDVADFDPGPGSFDLTSAGQRDIFVSKLDPDGNFLWAKQMGGINDDDVGSLAIDATGNVYTAGDFYETCDFDPGPGTYDLTSAGDADIFISKLDASGNFLWVKHMGGIGGEGAGLLTIDANGSIYAEGGFSGTLDFDPGPAIYNLTATSANDNFVLKFNGDPVLYIHPKIYTSKAILNVGQTQTITGKDFTAGGQGNLFIRNSIGDLIPVNSINYSPDGSFSYQLQITGAMPNGEYKVYALDINSGQTTTTIKFKVNNYSLQKLIVIEPAINGEYVVNKPLQIRWVDFIVNSNATGISGFVQKRYKIESSHNAGNTWQTIDANKLFPNVQSNQSNEFKYNYAFSQAGTYIIKITDLDNTSDNNTSISFSILAANVGGFTRSLEWDKSISPPVNILHPDGLAADGVSRIVIKLTKDVANTKTISNIHASIIDQSGIATGTDLLGKIKPANITDVYSDEANNANATFCDAVFAVPSSNTSFSFWLVAPDDFTQTANSGSAERVIRVDFTVTYMDNSTTTVTANNIRIVRPPLMMVHGLNGSSESFANAKFDIGNGATSFKDVIDYQTIWKYGKLPDLINYDSFDRNATELLGSMDNSFIAIIKQIRAQGYACNRVDYVCHSMGGSMARTVINKYPNAYYSQRNYNKGFINKFITINTPNAGSPIADFVVDLVPNSGVYLPASFSPHLGGFFVNHSSNFFGSYYTPSPAIKDLRAVNGGIRFGVTNVKNHMIGGDIDRYNVPDAGLILALNGNDKTKAILALCGLLLPSVVTGTDAIVNSINAYISLHYDYANYFSNSDVVVPVSSQFPGLDISSIPEVEDNTSIYVASNSYGLTRNHVQITDDISVGTKIMRLLNSSINSNYFSNQIAANPASNGSATYRNSNTAQTSDSILNYIDTLHIEIARPNSGTNLYVDSTIDLNILVKDTVGLRKIQTFFQDEYYESTSKVVSQTINVSLHSAAIGNNLMMVKGVYDSSGFTVYHIDTVVLNIVSADTLKGIYVRPKSQNLNSDQLFNPTVNAIYTNYIGTLNDNIDSLNFTIADNSVVSYIDSVKQFVTRDTGTTHIVFNYKGFVDTLFIYVGSPADLTQINICPGNTVSFFAGTTDNTKTYQWQLDSAGNDFQNITPSAVYSGINSPTLTLINAPSTFYNYKYRCLTSDAGGTGISPVFTLKFTVTWTGGSDTAWENISNWGCNSLPDGNTDVIVKSSAPRFPQINSNVSCRSLNVQTGATILVKTGYSLTITH